MGLAVRGFFSGVSEKKGFGKKEKKKKKIRKKHTDWGVLGRLLERMTGRTTLIIFMLFHPGKLFAGAELGVGIHSTKQQNLHTHKKKQLFKTKIRKKQI
jgi:hypothetical protein